MTYRWVEHTAEVQVEIEAGSAEAVFAEALLALAELLGEASRGDHPVSREIMVDGRERAVLLVEWLSELVYLAETADLVSPDVERIELSAGQAYGDRPLSPRESSASGQGRDVSSSGV